MDIFGYKMTNDRIDDANQLSAVNFVTLTRALMEKGILTPEEINKARAWATNYVDQKTAEMRDQIKTEDGK